MSVRDLNVLRDILKRLAHSRTDEVAWRLLFKQLWPFVFTVNYRLLKGNRSLAEDVSQEVFMRVLRYTNFVQSDDPTVFLAYVRAICKNTIRTTQSQMSREPSAVAGLVDIDLETSVDHSASPERAVASAERMRQVMAKLDSEDRTLLIMIVDGLSLEEMASLTGYTYSNIGVRIHRLRKSLLGEFRSS
jgi:RNA polymerase sigma factor (sigma-70 family)